MNTREEGAPAQARPFDAKSLLICLGMLAFCCCGGGIYFGTRPKNEQQRLVEGPVAKTDVKPEATPSAIVATPVSAPLAAEKSEKEEPPTSKGAEPPFAVAQLDPAKLRVGDIGDLDPDISYLPVKLRGEDTILSTPARSTFFRVPTKLLEPASSEADEKAVKLPGIWRVASIYRPTLGTVEYSLESSTEQAAKAADDALAKATNTPKLTKGGESATGDTGRPGASRGPAQVRGYTRRNGTYVAPYTRRR